MKLRGGKFNRYIDFIAGVPLAAAAGVYRRLSRRKSKEMLRAAILTPGAIGDTVLLSGLVNALRGCGLAVDIYTLGIAGAAELLDADNIYQIRLSKIPALLGTLRRKRYDLFIDSAQWARITAVITALSGAGTTVGFDTAGQHRAFAHDIRVKHNAGQHERLNFLALGQAVFPGIEDLPSIKTIEIENLPPEPYIVLHMLGDGSNADARMWRGDKWAALINILLEKNFNVILSGSPGEHRYCDDFIKYFDLRDVKNIAGKYSVPELSAVLRHAAAVISVNTGVMHLAAAAGAPVVGIHGPTSPLRWGPIGERTVAVMPEGAESFLNLGFETLKDDSAYSYRVDVSQVLGALEKLGVL